MTTSTPTATAPAASATPAAAGGQAGAATTAADPTAGARFTALLASLGGPTLVAGTPAAAGGTVPVDASSEAEPAAETPCEGEPSTMLEAAAAAAALVPLIPAPVVVPVAGSAAAETPTGPAGTTPAVTAPAAVDTNAVADAAADTVTVPVAPAALAAVADALPTPSADTTSDTTGDGPGDGDAKDDGQGAMPVTVATTVDDGVTTLPLPAAADATPTPSAPAAAAAAAPAATAATSTSDSSAKRGDDDRKTDAAAAVDASASTTGTTDASGTQASVTIAGNDRTAAADAAQVTARVDHERFERLADGLAARLRVSLAGDGARVRMHLTPRELGEVVVRLELKDGLATAHLIADNRDAGRLLTAAMADLRTALADRGLRLDSVQVRVAGDGDGAMHGHAHAHDRQHHQAPERRTAAPFTFGRLDALRAVETPLAVGEPERGVSVLA
jgi:flagellar hook-length control protein FliK